MKNSAILRIFLLTFLFIFYPSLVFSVFQDKVIESSKSAVVALYTDENLNYFRASGFFIDSSGTIITAKHVVLDYTQLWAKLYDGRKLEIIPVWFDEKKDLAILLPKIPKNEKNNFPYLKFDNVKSLTIGQPIMVVGNSASDLWQILNGNIIDLNQKIINDHGITTPNTIEHSSVISRGFSGSPLVDESGAVIGINIAKGSNSSFAVSSADIKSFIEKFYRKLPELIKEFK